ncbi:hypothetical protein SLOPH_815, partial [Spraguea lophii 42_110]
VNRNILSESSVEFYKHYRNKDNQDEPVNANNIDGDGDSNIGNSNIDRDNNNINEISNIGNMNVIEDKLKNINITDKEDNNNNNNDNNNDIKDNNNDIKDNHTLNENMKKEEFKDAFEL